MYIYIDRYRYRYILHQSALLSNLFANTVFLCIVYPSTLELRMVWEISLFSLTCELSLGHILPAGSGSSGLEPQLQVELRPTSFPSFPSYSSL